MFLTYGSRVLNGHFKDSPHLNKPFLGRDLRRALIQLVQGKPVIDVASQPDTLPGAAETGSGHEILVAEDNNIAAKVITTFLEKQGHHVTLSRNGEEALEQVHERSFDAAFVDLRMPRMDGLEFTRQVRIREAGERHMPIIALTANVADDVKQEALDAGMDDFLSKPVEPESLELMVEKYVGNPTVLSIKS